MDLTELKLSGPASRHIVERDVNGNLLYEGFGQLGAAITDSKWFILYNVYDVSGYYLETKSARNVAWIDRATVSYS